MYNKMKKLFFLTCISILAFASVSAQTDTISTNIYQKNGNLGIGTSNPSSKFEMICNETVTFPAYGILSIKNNHYATFDGFSASDIPHVASLINGRRSRGTILSPENVIEGDRLTGIVSAMYYDDEFHFNSSIEFFSGNNLASNSLPSFISFKTTGKNEVTRSERMRLSGEGNLGIGTDFPVAKLHISNGDIYIEDINRGIIMKSPNGQCWRGTLDNNGSLIFNKIDSPEGKGKIEQKEASNIDINVFPNPTNGLLTFEIRNNKLKKSGYHISTSNGKVIREGKIDMNRNMIDISQYANGLYFITVTDNSGNTIASKKIIKE